RRKLIEAGIHPALIGRVVLFGDPSISIGGSAESTAERDFARELLDDYFDSGEDGVRSGTASYLAKRWNAVGGDRRSQAAAALIPGGNEMARDESDRSEPRRPKHFDLAVTLADELRHLPAQATLRLYRAGPPDQEGTPNIELLRDAIPYLEPLAARSKLWA